MGKCHYSVEWEGRKDVSGFVVKEWGRKDSESKFHMLCALCQRRFSCVNGWTSVQQHPATESHKKKCSQKLDPHQLRLNTVRPPSDTEIPSSTCSKSVNPAVPFSMYTLRDNATIAELIWVMKCVISNYSFNSCCDIEEVFRSMFQDGVPQQFSVGATKATYLLTDALAPYFREELLRDIGSSYYTLCYEETTNEGNKKELQVAIRYWSETASKVLTQHLRTFFIGRATANDLVTKLYEAIDEGSISRCKLLMLGSDGPNVNKSVERKINDDLVSLRHKKLLDVGTCNIHILHNAFLAGLEELGDNVSDLIFLVHRFFHDRPSRQEDLRDIQIETGTAEHQFLKHVSSRWLTLEPAAERLVEQWDPLRKYFLKFVPQHRPALAKTPAYRRIVECLKDSSLPAEIHFVISSARVFTSFTGLFQRDEPLIHLLYSELERLVKTILGRIVKPESLKEHGVSTAVLQSANLPLQNLSKKCEENFATALSQIHEKDQLVLLSRAQKHFIAAASHIIKKSALKNSPL